MNMMEKPVRSLDAHYYTDPDIFKLEQRTLLAETWQFAGHISQVPNKGDYFCFSIGMENLFCIRGRDDKIRAFYNVCQHRAHEIVQGSGNKTLLVCPYHAWSYELTGHLRAGPNIKSVPGFERSEICLTEIKLENFNGFLFANLDPDAKPMDEWFPGAREELAAFLPEADTLQLIEEVHIPENCNWKVSIENYSECYHCSLNHPTFSNGVVKPETYDIQPQGYCLRHTTECQNVDQMTYPIDVTSSEHAGDYSSWFLWPLFSFQVYPGNYLNTYQWYPVDADHVNIIRGWYKSASQSEDVIYKLALQDRQTTVEEDIRLVESVHRGLKSRGYRPGPLVVDPRSGVNSEHSIMALQNWMKTAVDKHLD